MLITRDQNARGIHSMKIDNSHFERVEEFKYFGKNLSSSLLSKNLKIKIYRNIILPVGFYGCETWSLTLEERWLRVLRRIFGPKREEGTVEWRKLHNE
jgi:hypothetical protein